MREDSTDASRGASVGNCEGRGRMEKLYLIKRVGNTLGVGFMDAEGIGSAGLIVAEGSVCL